MLTFEVSTWQHLVNIATQSQADVFRDSVTMKLTADIDCNDEIPEGVETTLLFKVNGTGFTITIDGDYEEEGVHKRHVIRNLRTHIVTPVQIFNTNLSSFILQNIDFKNLILDNLLVGGGNSGPTIISNCRFIGKRSVVVFKGSNGGIRLTSCFFNLPYESDAPTNDKIPLASVKSSAVKTANFCWFREKYSGWIPSTSYPMTSFGNLILSGCYADGEVVCGESCVFTAQYATDSIIQNAMNVDIKTQAATGATIAVSAPKGIWKNDIQSASGASETYAYTNVNEAYAIPESPADMRNAQELWADGFDIVH